MIPGECYSVITPNGRGMTVQVRWAESDGFVVKHLDGKYAGDLGFVRNTDFYMPIDATLEVFDHE